MQIADCTDCDERFTRGEHSTRTICRACQGKRASRAQPEDRELERDNTLLETLCQSGVCFAEVSLNRLDEEQRLAVAEMLADGRAKACVVIDLPIGDTAVAAARTYLYSKGAKPLLLGTLAAIGSEVRPQVLN